MSQRALFSVWVLMLTVLLLASCEDNAPKLTENGHEYVDLGLPSGLMWATCNVGANKPEDYGSYFAWGEVESKPIYDFLNYKHGDGDQKAFTKYCSESVYGLNGFTDNKMVLDKEDDAAAVNMGGRWRMPTDAEMCELIDNTTWKYEVRKGVRGCRLTSNLNGKILFLPYSGYYYFDQLNRDNIEGGYGDYWTASATINDEPDYFSDKPLKAREMNFNADLQRHISDGYRFYGLTVRGVFKNNE